MDEWVDKQYCNNFQVLTLIFVILVALLLMIFITLLVIKVATLQKIDPIFFVSIVFSNKKQYLEFLRAKKTFIRKKIGQTVQFRMINSHQVPVLFSPMCLDDFLLGLNSLVTTFWERTAQSVDRMFSSYYVYFGYFLFRFLLTI